MIDDAILKAKVRVLRARARGDAWSDEARAAAAAARKGGGAKPEIDSQHHSGASLMAASIASGHITPEKLAAASASRKSATLKPGDDVEYTHHTIGGSTKRKATVTWDHGAKGVQVKTSSGESVRLEHANDGSLRRFT